MKLTLTIFFLFICNVLTGCFLFRSSKLPYPDPQNFTGVYFGDPLGEEKLILFPRDSTRWKFREDTSRKMFVFIDRDGELYECHSGVYSPPPFEVIDYFPGCGRYVYFTKDTKGNRYRYEGEWGWSGQPPNEGCLYVEEGCSELRLFDKGFDQSKSHNYGKTGTATICFRGDTTLIFGRWFNDNQPLKKMVKVNSSPTVFDAY